MKLSLPLVLVFLFVSVVGLLSTQPVNASNSKSFNYTALGDSITAASSSYAYKYSDYLNADLGIPINFVDLGIVGYTSGGLLYKLVNDQTFRTSVQDADLITVMIGMNDFGLATLAYRQGTCGGPDNQDCLRNTASNFERVFTKVISQIKSINTNPNTAILTSDIYYAWLIRDADAGNAGIFLPLMKQINDSIHSVSADNGIRVANVFQAFGGPDGLQDPIAKGYIGLGGHPSDLGHQVIAGQFRNLNSIVLAKDTDGDRFTNSAERYLGTDLLASCPRNSSHAAWPPDFDNNGTVTIADISAMMQNYNTTDHRYDFSMNRRVRIEDVFMEVGYYRRSCTQ